MSSSKPNDDYTFTTHISRLFALCFPFKLYLFPYEIVEWNDVLGRSGDEYIEGHGYTVQIHYSIFGERSFHIDDGLTLVRFSFDVLFNELEDQELVGPDYEHAFLWV